MADFAKYAKSTGGNMTSVEFNTKGVFTIECECTIEPSNWIRDLMLEKNGNGSSGLHFKKGTTILEIETPSAINVPTPLCHHLIHRFSHIPYIQEIYFYSNGTVKVVLGCVIEVGSSTACLGSKQRQELDDAEFMVKAIIEDFVEQHPVE